MFVCRKTQVAKLNRHRAYSLYKLYLDRILSLCQAIITFEQFNRYIYFTFTYGEDTLSIDRDGWRYKKTYEPPLKRSTYRYCIFSYESPRLIVL